MIATSSVPEKLHIRDAGSPKHHHSAGFQTLKHFYCGSTQYLRHTFRLQLLEYRLPPLQRNLSGWGTEQCQTIQLSRLQNWRVGLRLEMPPHWSTGSTS